MSAAGVGVMVGTQGVPELGTVGLTVESGFVELAGGEEAALEQCRQQLHTQGWTVLQGIPDVGDAERFLGRFGPPLPQYNGKLTYEVKVLPGFEGFQYSQSANEIKPHTEAPGFIPPPRYLALHCHRQAACGGGHTLVADGYQFIASLPEELREQVLHRPVEFQTTLEPGADAVSSMVRPLLELDASGVRILRYSYNFMRYNNLHPEVDGAREPEWSQVEPFFREMCVRGQSFFDTHQTRVLVPTHGLLIWDNFRMLHARHEFKDTARHLTRYWLGWRN